MTIQEEELETFIQKKKKKKKKKKIDPRGVLNGRLRIIQLISKCIGKVW